MAKRAANPATLVDGSEEWPETDELVMQWAKRSARQLDELISSTYG